MIYIINFIRTVGLSFFSAKLYSNIRYNRSGIGIKYLVILCLLTALPVTLILHQQIKPYIDNESNQGDEIPYRLDYIIQQFPEISIENGVVKTAEKGTFIITEQDSQHPLVIIDTTEMLKSVTETTASVLITSKTISYYGISSRASIISMSDFLNAIGLNSRKNYVVDRESLQNIAQILISKKGEIPIYIFISIASFSFLDYVIDILIFACFATVIAAILKVKINFVTCLRITAVAATPLIIIKTIALMGGQEIFTYPIITYFIMQLVYTYYAVESCKKFTQE